MPDIFETKRVSPMLLNSSKPFDDKNYIFELKLDGLRCLAYVEKSKVTLINKRYKDITNTYPELQSIHKCAKEKCILDGEVLCLKDGKPDFQSLQKRALLTSPIKINIAKLQNPVHFVAYDMIYYKDKQITDLTLIERKQLLRQNVTENQDLSVSSFVEGRGKDFFEVVKEQNLEGIIAKRKDGRYHIGKRTSDWLKIKVLNEEDLIICGYTLKGEKIKDLILGESDGKFIHPRGSIYFGFSKDVEKNVLEYAAKNPSKPLFLTDKDVVWIKPRLKCTVNYMYITENGAMRQPVFKGLKLD